MVLDIRGTRITRRRRRRRWGNGSVQQSSLCWQTRDPVPSGSLVLHLGRSDGNQGTDENLRSTPNRDYPHLKPWHPIRSSRSANAARSDADPRKPEPEQIKCRKFSNRIHITREDPRSIDLEPRTPIPEGSRPDLAKGAWNSPNPGAGIALVMASEQRSGRGGGRWRALCRLGNLLMIAA